MAVASPPRLPVDQPFVLLDDGQTGRGRLFVAPHAIVTASDSSELPAALARLREQVATGAEAAGFLAYEAGWVLQTPPRPTQGDPLLWFGLFDRGLDVADVAALLPPAEGAWTGAVEPLIEEADYRAGVAAAQRLIGAGDLYQLNLTFPARVRTLGHPPALYAGLRRRAGAGWSALVFTGTRWFLSLSPEQFFTLDGGRLTARPMKGTAPRGANGRADEALAAGLATDPKQQAENLMIVDLLRNDLARVAVPGSVVTPTLFAVETYPTVHQLTSTVTAQLAPGRDAWDVLAALFPCGSITGAPKRRAMEAIAELEGYSRGSYTGAVGTVGAGGTSAAFNVAIRTLELEPVADEARLGLGAGITADSDAAEEWRECLAKGAFVASPRRFDLVETMAFDPERGVLRLEQHLARLAGSAAAFGWRFDRHGARNELQAATFRLRRPARLRLVSSRSGSLAVEVRAMPTPPALPVTAALAPLPVEPHDFRLRHKTTDRRFYDRVGPTFDRVFIDPQGFVTEGGFTTVFVERDSLLLTPPLSRGLLPGVLRAELLAAGRAREEDLRPADLADGFLLGNSLRGLLPARLVAL